LRFLIAAIGRHGHAVAAHAYHYHDSAGKSFGRMVVSGAVHAVVWMAIRRLFEAVGLPGSIAVGAGILAIAFFAWRRFFY